MGPERETMGKASRNGNGTCTRGPTSWADCAVHVVCGRNPFIPPPWSGFRSNYITTFFSYCAYLGNQLIFTPTDIHFTSVLDFTRKQGSLKDIKWKKIVETFLNQARFSSFLVSIPCWWRGGFCWMRWQVSFILLASLVATLRAAHNFKSGTWNPSLLAQTYNNWVMSVALFGIEKS